jgi:osmotically-inducible protein OsmY
MNRTFSIIALQSAIAAAVLAATPLVSAEQRTGSQAEAVEATRMGGTQTVTVTGDRVSSNVKAAISQAVGEKSPDITVANRDGFISLGGWARTGEDVSRAMHVALAVDGVKQVYNDGVRLWSSRTSDY